jgi:glutathione S-transferase
MDDGADLIFHLAIAGEWDEACAGGGPYRRSTAGLSLEEQGFIHLSFAHQVQAVADNFYAGRDDVVLLFVDPRRLTAELKVEALHGAPEPFPHLYGPLDLAAVIAAYPVSQGPDGRLDIASLLQTHAPGRLQP